MIKGKRFYREQKPVINGVDKSGKNNPNWRGGCCSVSHVDEIRGLSSPIREKIRQKIVSQVRIDKKTECWEWTGSLFKNCKRPRVSVGKSHQTHRVVYALYKGKVGEYGVLHTCDNINCINPEHLWRGTNNQNSKDMVKKGRSARGEKNRGATLTEVQVKKIRSLLRKKYLTRNKIAKMFNVSWTCIQYIYIGKTWRYLL